MIQQLGNNDIVECANLMSDTWYMDEYQTFKRNEAYFIQQIINVVVQVQQGNTECLAIKHVVDGKIAAYMLTSCYYDRYGGELVMNIDDLIVDYTLGKEENGNSVKALIDYMNDHCKEHGVPYWRADSAHSTSHSLAYTKFLNKHYDGRLLYGFKGEVK